MEAQEIIETKNNFISANKSLTNKEYSVDKNVFEAILTLDKIAKKVRSSREKKGSINFNKQEVSFKLDKDNNPVDLKFKESKDANRLIEEFMLMANKKVAELFNEIKKQKYIFRIHDLPDKEKLKSLKTIIKSFGYTLTSGTHHKGQFFMGKVHVDPYAFGGIFRKPQCKNQQKIGQAIIQRTFLHIKSRLMEES